MSFAAIYCRVSTEAQETEGTSLESQKTACTNKAEELNYTLSDSNIFLETWTGAETDRPGLNKLRNLIRHKLIDAVICYSTDRLTRNPIHLAIIAEECEKKGVELIFVTEPLDKSPEGALIRYVKGYAAQIEREKIRERSLRGKREKARQGKLATGGPTLYGYITVNGKRVIDEDQARIIRMIYTWFARQHYTLYRAAAELNRNGITGKAGGKWSEQAVYRLLINPAYKGLTYAFRNKLVNKSHTITDKETWIEVPDATPAIVTQEVWESAQKQLRLNKILSRRNKKHKYLLSGRLICGVCGHSMIGSSKKKGKVDWLYYRCIRNVKVNYYDKCEQPSISARKVETAVWDKVSDIFQNPDVLLDEIQKNHGNQNPGVIEAEQVIIHNSLQKLRKEEERYIRLYGQEHINEAVLYKFLNDIKKKRDSLQKELGSLNLRQSEYQDLNIQDVIQRIGMLSHKLDDFEKKREALEMLNIRAILYPDGRLLLKGFAINDGELINISSLRNAKQFKKFYFSFDTVLNHTT